mmetsp:Transcript_10750/g.22850  ORF Transcript_10750/g.22850 Transcript_10750/m.22850 type:complete len:297 (-) Transcript_10750:157-1047(-)|eukprot:CAMPEP_0185848642 /NCGR_PEP_ID=MMETSP1354-20130828/3436_1 /TAXON_ID=708628 /ORGANISM="Erythrolobus madagascarensis, Strain CCMP3276" /LENGTH=296 /DNA_ID=CAMNT_0028549057 /DNA_START=70 /DNA_END=960 /DNA_ORIENTATION=-
MAAFVSGFSGAAVGSRREFGSDAVCSSRTVANANSKGIVMIQGNAKASVNMPGKAPTRGRRTVSFNARITRNRDAAANIVSKADDFFARSVTMQYKAFACPTGVYSVQCAEGSVKGAAHEKRAMSASAAYRLSQAPAAFKAHALFENRKHAIIASHGCQHEEDLFVRYPKLAAAYVMGQKEAARSCSRYVEPESIEEEFMAAAVDKQMKMRGAPFGVYSLSCAEANQKGQAEQARVAALAVAFRSTQKSESERTGERYAASKYARDHFGHGCEHEEQEFNKFPACGAAMRSSAYGY